MMSFQASLAKLSSSLKRLVTGAKQDGYDDIGKSEKDKTEVVEWLENIAKGDFVKPSNLKVSIFYIPVLDSETHRHIFRI
jgi:aminoacyl tRNA synthase complex-interacting multifunctional protein 1